MLRIALVYLSAPAYTGTGRRPVLRTRNDLRIPGRNLPIMKSFTRERRPIEFEIDDDKFDAVRAIPADTLMAMTAEFEAMDGENASESIKAMLTVLEQFLLPASFRTFRERMGSKEAPIEFPQVSEVIFWLLEQYGMRPTPQSSDSADGLQLPEPGTSLTGSTPDVVSISSPSPLISS